MHICVCVGYLNDFLTGRTQRLFPRVERCFLVCHRLMLLAIYFCHFINNDYNCPDVVFKYPSVQRHAKLCMLAGVAQAVTI